jgi:hypothetical protein
MLPVRWSLGRQDSRYVDLSSCSGSILTRRRRWDNCRSTRKRQPSGPASGFRRVFPIFRGNRRRAGQAEVQGRRASPSDVAPAQASVLSLIAYRDHPLGFTGNVLVHAWGGVLSAHEVDPERSAAEHAPSDELMWTYAVYNPSLVSAPVNPRVLTDPTMPIPFID